MKCFVVENPQYNVEREKTLPEYLIKRVTGIMIFCVDFSPKKE